MPALIDNTRNSTDISSSTDMPDPTQTNSVSSATQTSTTTSDTAVTVIPTVWATVTGSHPTPGMGRVPVLNTGQVNNNGSEINRVKRDTVDGAGGYYDGSSIPQQAGGFV